MKQNPSFKITGKNYNVYILCISVLLLTSFRIPVRELDVSNFSVTSECSQPIIQGEEIDAIKTYNVLLAIDASKSIGDYATLADARFKQARAIIETLIGGVLGRGKKLNLSIVVFDATVRPLGAEEELITWDPEVFDSILTVENKLPEILAKINSIQSLDENTDFPVLFEYVLNQSHIFNQGSLSDEDTKNLFLVLSDMRPVPSDKQSEQIDVTKATWKDPNNNQIAKDIEIFLFALDSSSISIAQDEYNTLMRLWRSGFASPYSNEKLANIFEVDPQKADSAENAFLLLLVNNIILRDRVNIGIPANTRNPHLVLIKSQATLGEVYSDINNNTLNEIGLEIGVNPYELLVFNTELALPSEDNDETLHRELKIGTKVLFPWVAINTKSLDFQFGIETDPSLNRYYEVWNIESDQAQVELSLLNKDINVLYFISGEKADFKVEFSAPAISQQSSVTISVFPNPAALVGDAFFLDFLENGSPRRIGELEPSLDGKQFIIRFSPAEAKIQPEENALFRIIQKRNGLEVDSVLCNLSIIETVSFSDQLLGIIEVNSGSNFEVIVPLNIPRDVPLERITLRADYEPNNVFRLFIDNQSYFDPIDEYSNSGVVNFKSKLECYRVEGSSTLTLVLNQSIDKSLPFQEKEEILINCTCVNSPSDIEKAIPFVIFFITLFCCIFLYKRLGIKAVIFLLQMEIVFGIIGFLTYWQGELFVSYFAGIISMLIPIVQSLWALSKGQNSGVSSAQTGILRYFSNLPLLFILFVLLITLGIVATLTCRFTNLVF